MSPSFLVKILCYTWRPFTISLASSTLSRISTRSTECYNHFRIRQRPVQIIADDARLMVKGLHGYCSILMRSDGDINFIR